MIALAALLRPEFSKALRFIFNRVEFYPAGLIEIGFAEFGPTIGIQGTLRAKNVDQFITSMDLVLTRKRDKSTHFFHWGVFRHMDYLQIQNSKIEVASAFPLQTASAKKIDIQFHDSDTKEGYISQILGVRERFQEYMSSQKLDLDKPDLLERGKKDFRTKEQNFITDVFSALGKEFYWTPGDYDLQIKLKASRPSKVFNFDFSFSLKKEDITKLELNKVWLIEAALFRQDQPNFIYVPYQALDVNRGTS